MNLRIPVVGPFIVDFLAPACFQGVSMELKMICKHTCSPGTTVFFNPYRSHVLSLDSGFIVELFVIEDKDTFWTPSLDLDRCTGMFIESVRNFGAQCVRKTLLLPPRNNETTKPLPWGLWRTKLATTIKRRSFFWGNSKFPQFSSHDYAANIAELRCYRWLP